MIVEDEITSQTLLQTIFENYGECEIIDNGMKALQKYNMSSQGSFDLICLDILLPKMNGLDVLQKIREIEAARGIHGFEGVDVIMITALDDFKVIKKAYNSYCTSYIVKPVNQEKVSKALKEHNLIE